MFVFGRVTSVHALLRDPHTQYVPSLDFFPHTDEAIRLFCFEHFSSPANVLVYSLKILGVKQLL